MRKRHIVVLSEEERAWLHTMIGRGVAPASVLTHDRILLEAHQGEAGPRWTDRVIATSLEVHPATVARIRQQYAAAGLDAALHRKPPARQHRRTLDPEAVRGLADGGLAADELEPDLVLLQRRQEPLGPPAEPVGPTLEIGHDQTLLLGSATPADVV